MKERKEVTEMNKRLHHIARELKNKSQKSFYRLFLIKKVQKILSFAALLLGILPLLFSLSAMAAPEPNSDAALINQAADLELSDAIHIKSASDFQEFAKNCSSDSWSRNKVFVLDRDIDLSRIDFSPIPTFGGIFLGQGYTISGLSLDGGSHYMGLFRYIQETGEVYQLSVSGTAQTESTHIGLALLAGCNHGLLSGCQTSGNVTGGDQVGSIAGLNEVTGVIIDCTANGLVCGSHLAGGIAGDNKGSISNSLNHSFVNTAPSDNHINLSSIDTDTALLNILSTENAASVTDIGGIAGSNSGVIRACVNDGSVGYQHVGYNIGGIAGSQSGYIEGCVNYGLLNGRKDVGGIAGQMEPSSELIFSEDTLEKLDTEFDKLHDLFTQLDRDTSSASTNLTGQVDQLLNSVEDAQNAVDGILIDASSHMKDFSGLTDLASLPTPKPVSLDFLDSLPTPSFTPWPSLSPWPEENEAPSISPSPTPTATPTLPPEGNDENDENDENGGNTGNDENNPPSDVDGNDAQDSAGEKDTDKALDSQLLMQEGSFTLKTRSAELQLPAQQDLSQDSSSRQPDHPDGTTSDGSPGSGSDGNSGGNPGSNTDGGPNTDSNPDGNPNDGSDNNPGDNPDDNPDDNPAATPTPTPEKTPFPSFGWPEGFPMPSGSFDFDSLRNRIDKEQVEDDINRVQHNVYQDASQVLENINRTVQDQTLVLSSRISSAQNSLNSSFSGIVNDMRLLNTMLDGENQVVLNDFQAIIDELNVITDLITNPQATDPDDILTDISDEDQLTDTTGKVMNCVNNGKIYGDLNVGGIAGSLSRENNLDPENDFDLDMGTATLNFRYKERMVVRQCQNKGAVEGKKDCIGGIAGEMTLGSIMECVNEGRIASDGNMIGGIAGSCASTIRASSSKCVLSGIDQVGGIAGYGTNISDCYSMVEIKDSENFTGSIAGKTAPSSSISNNFFVEGCPDGIDGISYEGQAQPLAYEEFLSAPNLPDIFRNITLSFVADDKTVSVATLNYGDSFSPGNLPPVPVKEGYAGTWEEFDFDSITFDQTIEAVYTEYVTTLESRQTIDGRPVALVEGSFAPQESFTLSKVDAYPADAKTSAECWKISISETASGPYTIRYLIPSDMENPKVELYENHNWILADATRDGSYYVFTSDQPDLIFCCVSRPASLSTKTVIFLTICIVFAAVILLLIAHNTRKKITGLTDKNDSKEKKEV